MWTGIDPSKWAVKTEDKLDLAIRKIALEMFSRVVLKSPVDTGRFRANWSVGVGSIPSGTIELNDKTGIATINKVSADLAGVKAGDVITLANNLPYGPSLEDGRGYRDGKMRGSKKAPHGMVALTKQEFESVVAKIGLEVVKL